MCAVVNRKADELLQLITHDDLDPAFGEPRRQNILRHQL